MRKKEYPKIIYPEGKDPIRVLSEEEAIEILGDKELIDRPPNGKVEPTLPQDQSKLVCRFCGKEYLQLHRRHFEAHEKACEGNNADRNTDSE